MAAAGCRSRNPIHLKQAHLCYYEEKEEGVFERKETLSSFDFYGKTYPLEEFRRILNSDLKHYENMLPDVQKRMPGIIGKYKKVVTVGGGIPKLETSILQAESIKVVELIPEMYKPLMAEFKELYNVPDSVEIKYEKKAIKQPYGLKEADVVVFCHFLEHQKSFKTIKKWLEYQKTDVIIYGPNIRKAKGMNWIHFGDHNIDHNTFFTIEALVSVAKEFGYSCETLEHSHDMLVWLKKEGVEDLF